MKQNFVIIICGPTGIGKSDLAVKIGHELPIEIINADIGSFYQNLTIGTAKPDWQNSNIPHHFFDIFDEPCHWTAPQFRQKLQPLIHEIWRRGNIPTIVGGSAFYVQSFFYKNSQLQEPEINLLNELEQQSTQQLWDDLHVVDPERACAIDPHDRYRLIRALAIWKTHGQKPSQFKPVFDPICPFYLINLELDRAELYEKINQRVSLMMQQGWLAEVQQLLSNPTWHDFIEKKKIIGYDLLASHLQGDELYSDLSHVVNLIAQKTRNYAKRQITFLSKLQSDIEQAVTKDEKYQSWQHKVMSLYVYDIVVEKIVENIKLG